MTKTHLDQSAAQAVANDSRPPARVFNASGGVHPLLRLQAGAGNRAVAGQLQRAVDPSKAPKIDEILNHSIGWVSNSKLERAWAELGTDLPEAINDSTYRNMWFDSVTKEGISLRDAGAPLIDQFKRDVVATAGARVRSQLDRLRAMSADLATPQKLTSNMGARSSDASGAMTPVPPRAPLQATSVIDEASYLDFLLNWDSILREVPVAVRGNQAPLLPTPGPKTGTPDLGPLLGPAMGPVRTLVTFDPTRDDGALLADTAVEYINPVALRQARQAWLTCTMNAPMYRRRAEMIMASDPNMAVLAESNTLRNVSKISRASEKDATTALQGVAKSNIEALERFQTTLRSPPAELWKALGPSQQQLLAGEREHASRDWSQLTARGFIEDLFAHGKETAAERDAARDKLIADLMIGAAAFGAALVSGGALTTLFLASLDAVMVASQTQNAATAHNLADAVDDAARANAASHDEAARVRAEADHRDAELIVGVILAVLPFLPTLKRGAVAGVEAVSGFLRASGTVARGAEAAEAAAEVGEAAVATARPRATREQLRQMLANPREYATWATHNEGLAKNGVIEFTGETNPLHPDDRLSLFGGVARTPAYGEWKVIVRREGRYLGVDAAGAAGEVKIGGNIHPEDSWWYHLSDVHDL